MARFSGVVVIAALLLLSPSGWAQDSRYREKPFSFEEMEEYTTIPFKAGNFETIANGMTQKEVLSLLGKPVDLKQEHRPQKRWTVHYFYPGGHVIHFRNGLVTGKERVKGPTI